MKIGIDIRLIGKKRTGDEQVFFNLVKNLAVIDSDNEYFLFTDCNPKSNNELKRELDKLNLKTNFKTVFLDSPNRFWWNLWALPNFLRKNPLDIFHTQYIAPFWIPKNVRLVLTIHDISFNFYPQFIKKCDLLFLKSLIPRSLRMASKIIAVSNFTKSEIEKFYGISGEKITVAPNGVEIDLFDRKIASHQLEEIRKKYKFPTSHGDKPEKILLYIGTLQPRKNIPVLIDVLRVLRKKNEKLLIKLVVAGNRMASNFDPSIDEAIKRQKLQDSVIFPGWIDEEDKAAFYKLADCFVFPSLYEGFGIPIIEAMAAGTPVVCSDQPALIEVGSDAVLACDPNDEKMLVENIESVLNNENMRKRMIEAGRKNAEKFSWKKTAEETLKAYRGA